MGHYFSDRYGRKRIKAYVEYILEGRGIIQKSCVGENPECKYARIESKLIINLHPPSWLSFPFPPQAY